MIESFYIKALIYSKNYTEFNCIEIFCDFLFVRQLNALQRKKKKLETSYVGFGASGVGFGAAMWGSEPLMWGSEVSFANNGVRRSEMWGSWPPSPPTLVLYTQIDTNI